MQAKKRFIFLLSHPIQYFSPLFQLIAKNSDFDLLVLYCSDENVKGHIDKGFGVEVKWDIPLLEGYNYKFLQNISWKPSIFEGFFGLINLEIFKILKKEKGSFLVIHGWNYFTHVLTIIIGKILGHKICIRGDNPYNQEILKGKKLLILKRILLGKFLFRFIDYFLYVGKQNKEFYLYYGVSENKLIFTPHAVDNDRFRAEYEKYKDKKPELRKELGLPIDKKIILMTGKYIEVKRPLDLLKAYNLLNDERTALVFLGDGKLRKEMEHYINREDLKNVYFTGFKNQSEISKYYSAADIFVLPSESETWGLVVNEAMNFGLPVILSDNIGCAKDLVVEGENGFIYETGNNTELTEKLELLLKDDSMRKNFSEISFKKISEYSFSNIVKKLMEF